MNAYPVKRIVLALQFLLVAAVALLSLFKPITDRDLWWHLKTGELLASTHALVTQDPFAFTSAGAAGLHERFIMTSYWLSQLFMHAAHASGGEAGLVLLKALLLAAIIATLLIRFRRMALDPLLAAPTFTAAMFVLAIGYSGYRPNSVSILGVAILAGMFERIRDGGTPSPWLYPLMILWANLHGGFVVGDMMLACFCLGTLIDSRGNVRKISRLLIWSAGGIAVSCLNPNGPYAFVLAFNLSASSLSATFVSEFISTFQSFATGFARPVIIVLWGMIATTLLALAIAGKNRWADLLVMTLLGYLALAYTRNMAFFAVGAAPYTAYCIQRAMNRYETGPGRRMVIALLTSLSIAIAALGSYQLIPQLKERNKLHDIPAPAADFIRETGLAGRMFNSYDWGGYLIWRLYPSHQVFIDGRVIREQALAEYIAIVNADTRGGAGGDYRALIDRYGIEFFLIKPFSPDGTLYPLVKRLLMDPGWSAVYLDDLSCIFARKSGKNARLVDRIALDKARFLNGLLQVSQRWINGQPGIPRNYIGKADILLFLGQKRAAEQELLLAQRIAPANSLISGLLEIARRPFP